MRIYTEKSLRNFEFWGGAESNAQLLTPSQLDMVEDALEDMCDAAEETFINDLFWFDFDWIATQLGFEDAEALERAARGESGE